MSFPSLSVQMMSNGSQLAQFLPFLGLIEKNVYFAYIFISEMYLLHFSALGGLPKAFRSYFLSLSPKGSQSKYLKDFKVGWGKRQISRLSQGLADRKRC